MILATKDPGLDFSADWSSQRSKLCTNPPVSDLRRHYALFVQPENSARAAESNALLSSLSFPANAFLRATTSASSPFLNRAEVPLASPTVSLVPVRPLQRARTLRARAVTPT